MITTNEVQVSDVDIDEEEITKDFYNYTPLIPASELDDTLRVYAYMNNYAAVDPRYPEKAYLRRSQGRRARGTGKVIYTCKFMDYKSKKFYSYSDDEAIRLANSYLNSIISEDLLHPVLRSLYANHD